MNISFRLSVAAILLCSTTASAQTKLKIKTEKTPIPKELSADISKILDESAVKLMDDNGKLIGEFWFRKQTPASPIADPAKKSFGYRDLRETDIIAAVRFHQVWPDYRRQKMKPGVYTLRLVFQPVDGNHIGASQYEEFCMALSASMDKKPEPFETKLAVKKSMKSINTAHPGVLMMFPPMKKIPEAPVLVAGEMDHWYIAVGRPVTINGKNVGMLGLSLGVAGAAEE